MFTGIVTDLGTVRRITPGPVTRLEIETAYPVGEIALGASVCCNGCCLSVVEKGPNWLAFEVSGETLSVTTLGDWKVGTRVNLERALKVGDELGGHLVRAMWTASARSSICVRTAAASASPSRRRAR